MFISFLSCRIFAPTQILLFAHKKVHDEVSNEHYMCLSIQALAPTVLLMMNLFTRDDKLLLKCYFHLALRVRLVLIWLA